MIKDPLVKNFLTNIVEGEENLPIVESLVDGIETDEDIAEKTGIRLNIVRKILYRLYDYGIASYKRSKDPETQWYTYTWKFEKNEVIKHINNDSEKYLEMLNDELNKLENNMYFDCPQGHLRIDFNVASEYEFICPECGMELEFYDTEGEIKQLTEDIKTVEENFKSFNKEVNK